MMRDNASVNFHVAGPACVDWSIRGKQRGLEGPSTMAFIVWLGQVVSSDVDCAIHEGTSNTHVLALPLQLMENHGQTWGMERFRLNPKDYGCPVARPRVYTVLYRKDKFAFSGCQEELDRFLCQSLLCTGQVFFQDAHGSSPLAAVSLNKHRMTASIFTAGNPSRVLLGTFAHLAPVLAAEAASSRRVAARLELRPSSFKTFLRQQTLSFHPDKVPESPSAAEIY
ncbi:Modification methylase MthTI [Symbiodinium microadriaticum]|uniref:Modification methylase MthTI n=1 Tax=Symbiodinium microadriaticum TaxID=2951 RepID=A0A1Q9DYG2_SYMMI|nr:Modification methylase MthTI [Symbiodinium microadriaticum]